MRFGHGGSLIMRGLSGTRRDGKVKNICVRYSDCVALRGVRKKPYAQGANYGEGESPQSSKPENYSTITVVGLPEPPVLPFAPVLPFLP